MKPVPSANTSEYTLAVLAWTDMLTQPCLESRKINWLTLHIPRSLLKQDFDNATVLVTISDQLPECP